MGLESKSAAVFCYCSDHVVGGAIRNLRVNFEVHVHLRVHKPGEVLDDFFSDPACVTREACWVKGNRTVEPVRLALKRDGSDLNSTQTTLTTSSFIPSVGVSKRFLLPRHKAQALSDSAEQHV